MYDDYFALLHVEPGQPEWAMAGALETAAAAVLRTYGGRPPHSLSMAIAILASSRDRNRYTMLLELSRNEGSEISVEVQREHEELARLTHFRFEQVGESKFRLTNLRVEQPPLPGERERAPSQPPPEPEPAPKAPEQPRESRGPSPSQLADLGCIDGQIPPLILGSRVYEWDFALCRLKHAARIRHWVQLTWVERNGREFTQRNYIGPYYSDDCFESGRSYWHVVLEDTITRERPSCVYVPEADGGDFYIVHSSTGLLQFFPLPWVMPPSGVSTAAPVPVAFPGLDSPPKHHFTPTRGTLQNNKELQEIAVRYIRETHYWGYCHTVNYQTTPEEVRKHSEFWVGYSMIPFGLKEKVLRRYGIKAM